MATYSEIEDLRDWVIDTIGEFLSHMDIINGEEPTATVTTMREHAENGHQFLLEVVKFLDELLVQKKRAGA